MSGGRGASALCRPLTMHEVKMRRTITTAAIAAMLLTATVALAAPTPEQKCQAAKNSAAGKYAACRQTAVKTLVSTGEGAVVRERSVVCPPIFSMKAISSAADSKRTPSPDDTCSTRPVKISPSAARGCRS